MILQITPVNVPYKVIKKINTLADLFYIDIYTFIYIEKRDTEKVHVPLNQFSKKCMFRSGTFDIYWEGCRWKWEHGRDFFLVQMKFL